ncbi:FtsX-like permease family protein [Undibacterium sp. RTI2.1]|uniref:ABC transporter permease n=1 Tax=unclassified Undibacterium TaxID=2630295 RepID=UPI002AB513C9|nr:MULTISPECIES: FtsX-like permease family protein [unclassified Undibacterium]MDY7537092.1 FtsX-like permease family protein [Undibacterium sp. 5I1]MEB0029869.1 FtsX-like permease family protein [Undibacterium sp. RTI2.1]MEB0115154.1 FtsX-like permease family protein [Undibacterium sp. RTI2.2]MEB0229270.1 FtsX-like permease family protein [Undibacterium sp. 10I3]MEB0256182.1 FtsX-like permease family protein [Undibacterium sp. 5I1]
MLRLSLRMTLRDWRAGELRFLLVALMIAVASLSSVSFFVDRMRNGLNRDAHQLLGADLLISADQAINPAWRSEAQKRGLTMAETVVFPSMAIAGEGDNVATKLVSLKAVTPGYPLRGNLKLSQTQQGAEVITKIVPPSGTVWIDPALLISMKLKIGDQLKLGDKTLNITQLIANEPDRGAGFMNFAPRVMVNMADLTATNLIQNGSRVTYRLLLAGPAAAITQFQKWLQEGIERNQTKGVRLESLESGRPEMRATLDRAEQFLSLVGLLSAMLAAVAVAMAARRFMLRHLDACAMLRCLGQTQNQVTGMYLIEFLMIGIVGSAAGVIVGFAGHYVLLEWLGKLVSNDLPSATWQPALQGIATGLLLLVGFALPPILQLRNVPHNRVIRREQDAPQALTLATYLLGLGMFIGLLLWQAGDVKLGLLTAGGFLIGLLVFALVSWLGVASLKRLRNLSTNTAWRFAVTALQRRPGATVIQVVSLALGLMALLLLTVVRGDLITAWKSSTPADAPNQFVINIQPDQKNDVATRLNQVAEPVLYPMIRGRLIEVNNKAITDSTYPDDRAKRLVDREFNLSTMTDMPASNTLVAGKWYQDTQPEASVEEGIAKTLGLKLGDKLTFDVAGQKITAPITSLRKLDWGSMRVNFFVIINPKAVVDLPQTWITAFHLPESDQRFVNQLTLDYPNLTVVDVGAMLKQVQSVLDQVITAVEFLFLFTLASGVLVLYAALAGSQDLRMREAALLRALGATRKQLSQAQWIEFLLVGGLAGVLAASGASAIGWALAHFSFNFEWQFSPVVWIVGLFVGAACALIGGWLGLRNVLNQPPLLSLREG